MTRYFLLVCLFFIPGLSFFADTETSQSTHVSVKSPLNEISWQALYQEMRLDSIIEQSAFEQAVAGYYKIKNKKREILTLIDFLYLPYRSSAIFRISRLSSVEQKVCVLITSSSFLFLKTEISWLLLYSMGV